MADCPHGLAPTRVPPEPLPAVVVAVGLEVPVWRLLPVRHLPPVLEEVRVVELPQRLLAVPGVVAVLLVAEVAVVVAPNTTRCKTSRLDRGASGRRAPHLS